MQINFLFIEGLELEFLNPRSIVVFVSILQGAIFVALLLFRYFKHKKTADFWLAILLAVRCSRRLSVLRMSMTAQRLYIL